MLFAALLSLLIAALLLVIGVFSGPDATTLELGPVNVETNSTVVFFLGMVTLLFLVLAVMLFGSAGRRAAARRRDRRKVSELSQKLEQFQRDEQDQRDLPTTPR